MLIVIFAYLIVMNIVGFALMGNDKNRAKHRRRRIPERTLFFFCIIGGSLGSVLGMMLFHHKTKHVSFIVGMRIFLIIHIVLVAAACFYLWDVKFFGLF